MHSHFEINVSKHGKHFFATHDRSILSIEDAKNAFTECELRFPEAEGFKITCTEYTVIGREIKFN